MAPRLIWPRAGSPRDDLIQEELLQGAERLFLEDSRIDVEGAILSENGVEFLRFENEASLKERLHTIKIERAKNGGISASSPEAVSTEAHFAGNLNGSKGPLQCLESCFFLLNPAYNWGKLLITQDALQHMLDALEVFPSFFRHLKAFGLKDFPQDEGYGDYEWFVKHDAHGATDVFESSYLLKYVELRDDAQSGQNPWSLRHTAVYQKVAFQSKRIDHIFVRLSGEMGKRLNQKLLSSREAVHPADMTDWTDVHSLCLDSVAPFWRRYINYLDEEVYKVFARVVISEVDPSKLRRSDTIESSSKDMKRLQYLVDQALRTSHMIDVNMETIQCMIGTFAKLSQHDRQFQGGKITQFLDQLQRIQQEHRFLHKNVTSLVERAKVLSDQLRDTISLRNSETNKISADLTSQNTVAIVNMTQEAGHETRVVKILTILALIFVPASFVAGFLQMGYVSIAQGTAFTLVARPELKMYAALAIPLVGVTMLVYVAVEASKERNVRVGASKLSNATGQP